MKNFFRNYYPVLIFCLLYSIITFCVVSYCYFWDNIQLISKEAHFYYLTDFSSLLMPQNNYLGLHATGVHFPLMGIVTACLWKIFGYNLAVSHIFMLPWAFILVYNLWKILNHFSKPGYVVFLLAVILLEPAVITQFVTASPDFILFSAFIMSFRAILERKPGLLAISLVVLCCISMRGIFVAAGLFISDLYYSYLKREGKYTLKKALQVLLPYIPVFIILACYYIYYFIEKGWFFNHSGYSNNYMLPSSIVFIIKHLMAFILRCVEHGRFIIWIFAAYFVILFLRKKYTLSAEEKFAGMFVLLMNGLYVLFVFITQMPFSPRYFIPQFAILTLLVLFRISKQFSPKGIKAALIAILFFSITGNLWKYPEKFASSWDSTLAHIPYYELREKCFDYIDNENINYKKLGGGFCFWGDRGYIELAHHGKALHGELKDCDYYIYSNISNLRNEDIDELKDISQWQPVKHFSKGYVFITLYERIPSNSLKGGPGSEYQEF